MAVIGTFGSFTAARLGIYASQSSLNVTGNNIANINTKGYTRQRLDLVSLNAGGNSRYANKFDLDIGYGVIAQGVSQLRDPFMDIRYRNEQASLGAYEARVEGLQQLANRLDEVGTGEGDFGRIEAQFNEVMQQLQILSRNANDNTNDTNVRSACETLTQLFHQYSSALDTAKETQTKQLKQEVESVNETLTQIRDLSEQIREAGIHGDSALELRDSRNVLIDELSKYMKIDVRYDMEKIDEFTSVERINISIADSGTPPIKLIQGIYGAQISMPDMAEERNPDYDPTKPTSCRYISEESDLANNKIVYTNDERKALMKSGQLVTNPLYDITAPGAGKYIVRDKNNGQITGYTDDPAQANMINNAVEGEDDNRLWMSVEPLKDRRDRLMKEDNGAYSVRVDLSDTQLYGSLQTMRELITREGEFSSTDDIKFDPNATIKRGIPYYEHSLDALARKFAQIMNEANTTVTKDPATGEITNMEPVFMGYETKVEADGVERYQMADSCNLTTGDGDATSIWQDVQKEFAAKGEIISDQEAKNYLRQVSFNGSEVSPELQARIKALQDKHLTISGHGKEKQGGGVLFSNGGDSNDWQDINADNISISFDWSTGAVRILNTRVLDGLDHTTDSTNIEHMISLMETKFDYLPSEVVDDPARDVTYYSGTFQERFRSMTNVLANDQRDSTIMYNGYTTTALALDNDRQSVSGVDLNEEATSMMMFQKSYSAACQLMTTLDSMLDKLINDTIR